MKVNEIRCDICGGPIRGKLRPLCRGTYLTYWVKERVRRNKDYIFEYRDKWKRRRVDVCKKCFDAFADFVKERIGDGNKCAEADGLYAEKCAEKEKNDAY